MTEQSAPKCVDELRQNVGQQKRHSIWTIYSYISLWLLFAMYLGCAPIHFLFRMSGFDHVIYSIHCGDADKAKAVSSYLLMSISQVAWRRRLVENPPPIRRPRARICWFTNCFHLMRHYMHKKGYICGEEASGMPRELYMAWLYKYQRPQL